MASHPELSGCMSHGVTPKEAITNLMEAKELYMKTLLEKGEEIPLPSSSFWATWEIVEASEEKKEEEPYIVFGTVAPMRSSEIGEEEITVV
jgi:predicted RNase H-like HicB family nuclease